MELQVDDGDLQQIRMNNGDSKSRLRGVFRKWLTQTSPKPSWSAIVEAVQFIGDENLVCKLRARYVI